MLSLGIVVERFCFALGGSGPQGRILVERRNQRLDRELTIAWDVLRLYGTRYVRPEVLRRRIAAFEFATKATGGGGLEIADLVITPLDRGYAAEARSRQRPQQAAPRTAGRLGRRRTRCPAQRKWPGTATQCPTKAGVGATRRRVEAGCR